MRVPALMLNTRPCLLAAALAIGLASGQTSSAEGLPGSSDALGGDEDVLAVPFEELTYFTVPPERSCRFDDEPVVLTARISLENPERGIYLLELTTQEIGDPEVDECDLQIGAGCIVERVLPPRRLSPRELAALSATLSAILADLPEGQDPICPLWDPCMIEHYTVDGKDLPVDPCAVPRLSFEQGEALFDLLQTLRRGKPTIENGDGNGDGARDLADVGYLIQWLFSGAEEPVPVACLVDFDCAALVIEENGDTNGDGSRDLTDVVYLLNWLFSGGPEPLPLCTCGPLLGG